MAQRLSDPIYIFEGRMNQLKEKAVLFFTICIIVSGSKLLAQQDTLLLSEEDEAYLNELLAFDSLLLSELDSNNSILQSLLDSVAEIPATKNSISLRLAYTSDILNAGRNFGFNQFGVSAGGTYYHQNGFFADVAGYWNSDFEPKYNLTTTTIGYMGFIGKHLNYTLSYDHFFYRYPKGDTVNFTYPLTNAVNSSLYVDIKNFSIGADYQFLFGDENAHRLRLGAYYYLKFNKVGFIDRISIVPGFSVLGGNSSVYYFSQVNSAKEAFDEIVDQYGRFTVLRWYQNEPGRIQQEVDARMYEEGFNSVFGIMNYALSAPVSLYIGNSIFSFSYYLNIPVALPGETIDTSPNSFFSVSYFYNIQF